MTRHLSITGNDLKAARKVLGYNQSQLGELVGVARCTVSYWENKQVNLWRGYAVDRMMEVLNLKQNEGLSDTYTRARGRGFTDYAQQALGSQVEKERAKRQAALMRVPCLAKTRKGHPCRNKSEAGRKRCKFHGGMSTGPRTAEGKARVAEAQRLRWQHYRAQS